MYKQKDSDLTCIMLYTNVEKQTTPTLKKSVTVSKDGILVYISTCTYLLL